MNSSVYSEMSEKEIRLFLTPLVTAIMAENHVGLGSPIADNQEIMPLETIREYESLVDIFVRSFKTIHGID